ncbi:MAG: leucine-rich repeat protein [Clostridia bacterium]|nr:leucine-rich repeat protein [Clostridia bacterium]
MKKTITFILTIMLLLQGICLQVQAESVNGQSETYMENDIIYLLTDEEAKVIGYTGTPTVLTIPDRIGDLPVTEIGIGAFSQCETLTTVNIPDSVRKLDGDCSVYRRCQEDDNYQIHYFIYGTGAFNNCTNLTEINFGVNSQLSEIGPLSFANTPISSIHLPSCVSVIGAGAFYQCNSLTSVELNEGITTIGDCAFSMAYQNNQLFRIDLPNSIEQIGAAAFAGTRLTSVTLPDHLRTIGETAFASTWINAVHIPSSVQVIGACSFNTDSFSTITVDEDNANYSSLDGVLFSKDKKVLCLFPNKRTGDYQVPNTVNRIDDYAFYISSVTNVIIPESVSELGICCFSSAVDLESINIPTQITVIPKAAFFCCYSLQPGLVFPERLETIDDLAFVGVHLNHITLGENLKYIGNYAFQNTRLRSLVIPDSVEHIGTGAFFNNIKLTDVTMSEEMLSRLDIEDIFEDTPYLGRSGECGANVTYLLKGHKLTISGFGPMEDYVGWSTPFNDQDYITEIEIEDGINYIGDASILNMEGITEIAFPYSVIKTGKSLFQFCSQLCRIIFYNPNCVISPLGCANNGITIVGYDDSTAEAFALEYGFAFESMGEYQGDPGQDEEHITGVIGSSSVAWDYFSGTLTLTGSGEAVPQNGCGSEADYPWYTLKPFITKLIIENGVTEIGNYAFCMYTYLSEITLPETLISIGDFAFQNCTELVSVHLPDGITQLGECVFGGCTALECINVPSSLTYISSSLFNGCKKLQEVALPDGIVAIGDGSFANCTLLETVILPAGVCEIGPGAFSMSGITQIEIPASVQVLERYTFDYCRNLQSVTLHEGLKAIEHQAFECCTSLTSICLPQGVQTIDYDAFRGCDYLLSISIPDSVIWINNNAFPKQHELITVTCHSYALDKLIEFGYSDHDDFPQTPYQYKVIHVPGERVYHWNGKDMELTVDIFCMHDDTYMNTETVSDLILLPAELTEIDVEAFSGMGCRAVILPEGCLSVGSKAFSGCSKLIYVYIPSSVKNIADDAFEGCDQVCIERLTD